MSTRTMTATGMRVALRRPQVLGRHALDVRVDRRIAGEVRRQRRRLRVPRIAGIMRWTCSVTASKESTANVAWPSLETKPLSPVEAAVWTAEELGEPRLVDAGQRRLDLRLEGGAAGVEGRRS